MLFADSLLETRSAGRGWTTLLSYSLEAALVGLLVMAPLLTTSVLPTLRMSAPLVVRKLGEAPSETPRQQPGHSLSPQIQSSASALLTPRQIPLHVSSITEEVAPPTISGSGSGAQGKNGPGDPNGVPWGIADAKGAVPILAHPSAPHAPVRISQLSPADLINGPRPLYPVPARLARIEGTVVLSALIARDGSIQRLQVQSGHPMLVSAAVDAVRQWRYRPYMLNGEAVEVETQITVNFSLSGN